MPRKRANRRKSTPRKRVAIKLPKISLPIINWARIGNAALLASVLCAAYFGTLWAMDQEIRSIRIEGSFERVSAMQIESSVMPFADQGFLTVDLKQLQQAVQELTWVGQASVRRSWPATLIINVTEERAVARWHEDGLLNIYGELFVEHATHIPAELPQLSGPPGTELEVAKRFFALDARLKQRGLTALSLQVDDRGAWGLLLNNGMKVRLGAVAIDERTSRFFDALDQVLASVVDTVDYIDMRYTNGFAVGWKPGADSRLATKGESKPHA